MSCTIDASASAGGLMPTAATPLTGSITPQFAPTMPTATAVAGASGGAVSSLGGGGTAVAGAASALGGGAIAPILQELSAAIAALTAAIQPLIGGGAAAPAPSGTAPVTGGGPSGCGSSTAPGGDGGGGGAAGAPTAAHQKPEKHQSDGGGGGNVDKPKPDAAPPTAAAGGGTGDAGTWLTGDLEGLDAELTKRLATLGERLGDKLTIVSGNRTFAEQTVLYDRYKAGTGNLAAKPGTSNHEGGDAADVNINGTSLANNAKAKQLAAELGLHFPVPGEPWHVEVK